MLDRLRPLVSTLSIVDHLTSAHTSRSKWTNCSSSPLYSVSQKYFVTLIIRFQAKFGVILNYDNLKLLQLDIGLLRVISFSCHTSRTLLRTWARALSCTPVHIRTHPHTCWCADIDRRMKKALFRHSNFSNLIPVLHITKGLYVSVEYCTTQEMHRRQEEKREE